MQLKRCAGSAKSPSVRAQKQPALSSPVLPYPSTLASVKATAAAVTTVTSTLPKPFSASTHANLKQFALAHLRDSSCLHSGCCRLLKRLRALRLFRRCALRAHFLRVRGVFCPLKPRRQLCRRLYLMISRRRPLASAVCPSGRREVGHGRA